MGAPTVVVKSDLGSSVSLKTLLSQPRFFSSTFGVTASGPKRQRAASQLVDGLAAGGLGPRFRGGDEQQRQTRDARDRCRQPPGVRSYDSRHTTRRT